MSNHSIKFDKDLISNFLVILLTDKQTDTDEIITSLAGVKIKKKLEWHSVERMLLPRPNSPL